MLANTSTFKNSFRIMATKTRKFFICRRILEKQGEKDVLVRHIFTCNVNASVPPNHRMLR